VFRVEEENASSVAASRRHRTWPVDGEVDSSLTKPPAVIDDDSGGNAPDVNERRAFPRRTVDVPVVAAVSSESVLPSGRAVDIGRGGMLMSFVEPLGFLAGDRMLVTLPSIGFRFHALGSVVRCERGLDFRTYVAMKFIESSEIDYDELCQRLDESSTSAS